MDPYLYDLQAASFNPPETNHYQYHSFNSPLTCHFLWHSINPVYNQEICLRISCWSLHHLWTSKQGKLGGIISVPHHHRKHTLYPTWKFTFTECDHHLLPMYSWETGMGSRPIIIINTVTGMSIILYQNFLFTSLTISHFNIMKFKKFCNDSGTITNRFPLPFVRVTYLGNLTNGKILDGKSLIQGEIVGRRTGGCRITPCFFVLLSFD